MMPSAWANPRRSHLSNSPSAPSQPLPSFGTMNFATSFGRSLLGPFGLLLRVSGCLSVGRDEAP